MGDRLIQPVIQPITIDTMLNNNRPTIGDELIFVTYEQTLIVLNFILFFKTIQ